MTWQTSAQKTRAPCDDLAAWLGTMRQAALATCHKWNPDIVFDPIRFHQSQPPQTALALLLPLNERVDDARQEVLAMTCHDEVRAGVTAHYGAPLHCAARIIQSGQISGAV